MQWAETVIQDLVLLRPLPFYSPEILVQLYESNRVKGFKQALTRVFGNFLFRTFPNHWSLHYPTPVELYRKEPPWDGSHQQTVFYLLVSA